MRVRRVSAAGATAGRSTKTSVEAPAAGRNVRKVATLSGAPKICVDRVSGSRVDMHDSERYICPYISTMAELVRNEKGRLHGSDMKVMRRLNAGRRACGG